SIVIARWADRPRPGEGAFDVQPYIQAELEDARRAGFNLQLNLFRQRESSHLILRFGSAPANVLCHFADDELGLPLTHANPYDLLAAGVPPTTVSAAPVPLQRPLEADVVLPPGAGWHSSLAALARAARLDVL